jgi:CRP-like cAMP-binding protein
MWTGSESALADLPAESACTAISSSAVAELGSLLYACGSETKSVRFRKGTDVVIAGSRSKSLYINHDGWLYGYKILHNGGRQVVKFVLPGELFGLQSLTFATSLYSIATVTPCTLSKVPVALINRMAGRNAKLTRALLHAAVAEAAILGEHLINAGRRSAYGRVGHFLLELFVRLKRGGWTEDMSFDMPLTQELIGDALGLSPVHVNRTLRSLRDDKLIALHGRHVTLRDFAALCGLSDFEGSYLGDQTAAHDRATSAAAGGAQAIALRTAS